jgi:hypothetical protein
MASRSKSAILTVVLALLLSLHSTTSLSLNPSYSVSRIKEVRIASSSPLSASHVHRRHHRHTAVGAADAAPINDWKPINETFSRRRASPVVVFLHSCYTRYLHLCENRPFVINSIAAGVLAGAADTLAQSLQTSSAAVGISPFNWVRWRRFTLTGLLFEGPWMTFWFKCLKKLGRWMEIKFQAGPRQQVLGQVVAGRTLGAVIFFPMYFVVYECIGAILSGQGKYVKTNVNVIPKKNWQHVTNYSICFLLSLF